MTGHNSYKLDQVKHSIPFNIPASRFLYWHSKLKKLETLRLKRILADLIYAAKWGEIYHLWWHPHNFGVNLNENIQFLEKIFKYFHHLKRNYKIISLNMSELANIVKHDR